MSGLEPAADRRGVSRHTACAGYPACPDHMVKGPLFSLLDARRNADMRLTESFAMLPAASVSGFYLSHPQSSYFAVGRSAATSSRTTHFAPAECRRGGEMARTLSRVRARGDAGAAISAHG